MKESKERNIDEKRQEILEQIRKKNEISHKILDKYRKERENRLLNMNVTIQNQLSIKPYKNQEIRQISFYLLKTILSFFKILYNSICSPWPNTSLASTF